MLNGPPIKLDESNTYLPEFKPSNHHVLEYILMSDEGVIEAINMIKSNKASCQDLIDSELFKEGADQLVLPLRKCFNLSLILGEFSASWKRSSVTAIHKKDDRSNPSFITYLCWSTDGAYTELSNRSLRYLALSIWILG